MKRIRDDWTARKSSAEREAQWPQTWLQVNSAGCPNAVSFLGDRSLASRAEVFLGKSKEVHCPESSPTFRLKAGLRALLRM